MAIIEDKDNPGQYVVSYGKRHPLTGVPITRRRMGIKSKKDATRILAKLVLEVDAKIRRSVTPTWCEAVRRWLVEIQSRYMSSTVYNYKACLEAHTMESWGDRFIDTITTQEIRDLLSQKLGNRSVSHQEYVYKAIKLVFAFGVEAGFLTRNPAPKIKFRVGDKIRRVLNEEQAKTLLAKAKELNWEWYPHYALALYTGMRSGELFALTWDQVDLARRNILINQSWNNRDGFKSTKSGDDRRVDISPALMPLLQNLKEETSATGYVLPRLRKWGHGEQARDLKQFLIGIGLPVVRFHDLRASWATVLLDKGVQPIKVMKMGGWKDIETMMIYARKSGVDIKGATGCLDFGAEESAKILSIHGNVVPGCA